MATNEELRSFVRNGLARGVPRAELEDVLDRAGWPASEVHGALTSFAEVQFPIPCLVHNRISPPAMPSCISSCSPPCT